MAPLKEPVGQVQRMIGEMSLTQRILAASSVLFGAALFAGLAWWSSRENYAPLMTNLSPEDAQQITERLSAAHVPFRTTAGGTAVLVPEEQVHQERLRMAGEGLPHAGNVGFELFDEPNFGMSHFAEELNYRRGLEGELRRTIRQIDAVKDARVHIVVAERGLFREQEQPASAAVTLTVHPGRKLSSTQVQAITHLVAASVGGLLPDHVTVVDQTGTLLSRAADGAGGDGGTALEKQRAIERNLEERVAEMLVPIVGVGHLVVRVSAALDFARQERTQETYDPSTPAIRSEQFSEENRGPNAAVATGGVPGARSNLTGVQKGTAETLSNGNSSRRLETRNYEINKVVEHNVGQMGRLARLSVAVLVDGVAVAAADGSKKFQERSAEELTRLTEMVRRAVGYDADRDDQVVVQSMLFEQPPPAEVPAPEATWMRFIDRYWLPAMLTALGLALTYTIVRRDGRGKALGLPIPQILEIPRTVRELEQVIESGGISLPPLPSQRNLLAAAAGGSPAVAGMPVGDALAATEAQPVVAVPTRPDPEQAANVLKGWLTEE